MWHYLCFIVLVKVKDSTEYTGPESYVAEMIKVSAETSWRQVTLRPAGPASARSMVPGASGEANIQRLLIPYHGPGSSLWNFVSLCR